MRRRATRGFDGVARRVFRIVATRFASRRRPLAIAFARKTFQRAAVARERKSTRRHPRIGQKKCVRMLRSTSSSHLRRIDFRIFTTTPSLAHNTMRSRARSSSAVGVRVDGASRRASRSGSDDRVRDATNAATEASSRASESSRRDRVGSAAHAAFRSEENVYPFGERCCMRLFAKRRISASALEGAKRGSESGYSARVDAIDRGV
jgi:hypothetical protein